MMGEPNCHEEIEVYGVADRVRLKAGGERRDGGGSLSEAGDQRSDVLQLEEEVQRVRTGRAETVAPVGRRERALETDRGGPDVG